MGVISGLFNLNKYDGDCQDDSIPDMMILKATYG